MEIKVKDFANLYDSLKTDEIVYLFGAGLSSALTGRPYPWKRWLRDGISHMKDFNLAKRYSEALENEDSANGLIDLVGKVIAATKADGTYSEWMGESFEKCTITNVELVQTLKKMLIGHDVFATTNYDTLLEQATGLGTYTYENADLAFKMLDEKKNTNVLHIHGVYDSQSGLDNIIANKTQYNCILENQGAQFIQHILGTRTLIFVGCGKTTEDVNIAKFIEFANKHLGMDRKYFFLYKEGEKPCGLPDNVELIPYGDDYSDMPRFLEDMAQIRLRSLVEKYPLIGRTAYEKKICSDDPLLQYHYSMGTIPFCGRKEELSLLGEFLMDNGKFKWWAITGQAGAGKSRLALEYISGMPSKWFGFFINDRVRKVDFENFVPFSDTLIVIDYVSGREGIVANFMRSAFEVFDKSPYALRIMLIERDNNRQVGSWYGRLTQRFGKYENLREQEYKQEFLNITDLDDTSVESFIGKVFEHRNLPHDASLDRTLRQAYWKKFEKLRYRPLYVQMFVEAYIDEGFTIPRYDSFEELLEYILRREQERWLKSFGENQKCCNAFVRILLRANISGELKTNNIPEFYREDWQMVREYISEQSFPGRQRNEMQNSIVNDICQNIDSDDGKIAPMFPDVIKEYMFAFYSDPDRLEDVVHELWRNAAHEFSIFITRCLTDFPNNEFYENVYSMRQSMDEEEMMGRLELLKKREINTDDDPYTLLKIIYGEFEYWRSLEIPTDDDEKMEVFSILKFAGLDLVATQLGSWSFNDVSPMMEAIEEALRVPGSYALDIFKIAALQRHINNLACSSFAEATMYLKGKLDEIAQKCPDPELSSTIHIQNRNVEMMNCILIGDFSMAATILEKMYMECDTTSIESVRSLSHSCFNFDNMAANKGKGHLVGKGYKIVQKLESLYPNDWNIRARSIGCQTMVLQYQYVSSKRLSKESLKRDVDDLEQKLSTMSFGSRKDCDDALSQAWAAVKILKVNVISSDAGEIRKIMEEADEILSKEPNCAEIVQARIIALHALHKDALGDKVSSEEVEDVFKYVEACHDSETVRNAFFLMLDDSEVADKRANFMTKNIRSGAIQDARFNPLTGSGIPEIDEEVELLNSLFVDDTDEPYRRTHKKVGRNDPCPCGSGKKFKKCCEGLGIYD